MELLTFVLYAVNTFNNFFNRANQKEIQEETAELEKEIQKDGFNAARERFNNLCNAKRKLAEAEFKASLERAKAIHHNNLMNIEHSSSLSDWPLSVLPMALHNDQLILTTENFNEQNKITPITIISGPCRDSAFQENIWRKAEEYLSQLMLSNWAINSSHPILFYQDAWKDNKSPIDGTHCANIHSKIPNIPTIIISPILTKSNSLQFEITYWSLQNIEHDLNKPSIKETSRIELPANFHQYQREDDYNKYDCEQLAKELASFLAQSIGLIADIYMWNKYHVTPLLPTLHHTQQFILNDYNNIKKFYCEMFRNNFNNGDIHALIDLDLALDYCNAIDYNNDETQAFSVLCEKFTLQPDCHTLPNIFQNMPKYDNQYTQPILNFCKQHQDTYNINDESIEELKMHIAYNYLLPRIKQQAKDTFAYPNNFQKKLGCIVSQQINEFKIKCNNEIIRLNTLYAKGEIENGAKYKSLFYNFVMVSYRESITKTIGIHSNSAYASAKKYLNPIISKEYNSYKSKFDIHLDNESKLRQLIIKHIYQDLKINIDSSSLFNYLKGLTDYSPLYDCLYNFTHYTHLTHLEPFLFERDALLQTKDDYFFQKAEKTFKKLYQINIYLINRFYYNFLTTNNYTKGLSKNLDSIFPYLDGDSILNPYLSILQFDER